MSWTERNLAVQGYCLTADESTDLRWAVRFPTAVCLALVGAALVLQSPALMFALVPVGAVAGWTRRHPFDLVWNGLVQRLGAGAVLPPNPTRRRHAFKAATLWLLLVAALLAAGETTAATLLGLALVGACTLVTATNFCIPSTLLALWSRRHRTALSSVE